MNVTLLTESDVKDMIADEVMKHTKAIMESYLKTFKLTGQILSGERLDDNALLKDIGLPEHLSNKLINCGFETVGDVRDREDSDIAKYRNIGEKSIRILRRFCGYKTGQV